MRGPPAPRGYKQGDFPLQHEQEWNFGLTADTAPTTGGNSTILPLFFHDEDAEDPTAIQVNPRNAGFDVSNQSNCVSGSIIPRTSFSFSVTMSEDMIEVSKARSMVFYWWPVYSSFEDADAEDYRTGVQIFTISQILASATNEESYPNYDATKLLDAWTMPNKQLGLT